MSDRPHLPHRLDLLRFAGEGAALEGSVPLTDLARLAESLAAPPAADATVRWRARGESRPVTGGEPETWLHLSAETVVPLACQRCLKPLSQPLELQCRLRFVRDEQEAARLDEHSEDDVLVLPSRLNLVALIEDEVILALPLVPRHEHCPEPLPMSASDPGADGTEDEVTRENPFAALAALRRPPRPN